MAVVLLGIAITLGIAIVGWNFARRANHTSQRALELAQSAEERAERTENLTRERADIEWTIAVDHGSGRLTYTHVGTDPADDVELVFDNAATETRTSTVAGTVAPTAQVSIESSTETFAVMAWASPTGHHGSAKSTRLRGRARLTWRTQAGAAGIRTDEVST
jgi:hypothetical protein